MKNKRTSTLILIIAATLLAACATGPLSVTPLVSEPARAGAVAGATLANREPTTDVNSGPDDQALPEDTPVAETLQPLAIGRVTTQGLNLRAGPSINHRILGLLAEGTELEIQGRSENLQWLLVQEAGGAQGWVYFEYVHTQAAIASLPLKEAYGGPSPAPSNAGQDVRQPLNVQASIENNLAIVSIAGFPADSKVIARLGEVGESADLYVGDAVTTPNGNAVIRFSMPSLSGEEFNLVVSTANGDERVDVRIQYFHD